MEFKSFLFDYNNNSNKDFFDQLISEKNHHHNINNINSNFNNKRSYNKSIFEENFIYNHFQNNIDLHGDNDDDDDDTSKESDEEGTLSSSNSSNSNSDNSSLNNSLSSEYEEDEDYSDDKNKKETFSLTNNWLFNKFFKNNSDNNNNNNNNNNDDNSGSSSDSDSDNYINYDIHTFINNNNNKLELLNNINKDIKNNNNNNITNNNNSNTINLPKSEMFSKISKISESPFNLILKDTLELERQVSSSIPIPVNNNNNHHKHNNNHHKKINDTKTDNSNNTTQYSSLSTYSLSSSSSSSSSSSPSASLFEQDNLKLDDDDNNNILINENNNELIIKCVDCLNTPTLVDDIIFLDCSHFYCRKCLYNFIMNRINEKKVSKIKCKCCKIPLSVHDIKQVLNEEECSVYDKASLDQVISKNKGKYIQCPCCSLFIEKVLPPPPSPSTKSNNNLSSSFNGSSTNKKRNGNDGTSSSLPNFSTGHHHHRQKIEYDDNGRPLSKESLEHKRKYRLRCPQCSTIFCSECFINPYHLGYTCAQYQIYNSSKHCRFCKIAIFPILPKQQPTQSSINSNSTTTTTTTTTTESLTYLESNVCSNSECRLKSLKSCDKILKCGHECLGLKNEDVCLPCIEPNCNHVDNNNKTTTTTTKITTNNEIITILTTDQKSNDYCNICWTDDLSSDPCIQLECGHIFHYSCCKNILKKKWSSPRISFGFTKCALCSQTMNHPSLKKYLDPINELYNTIKTKALNRLEITGGPEKDISFDDVNSKWYNNKEGYVMERFSYFMCFKCKKPYFGGEKACGDNRQDFKPDELICGGCSSNGNEICKIHGKEFIEYKCKYCCNISIFFCWGKTHFCADCHKRVNEVTKTPKHLLPQCKCDVEKKHEVGEEFCFGCTLCIISD